MWLSPALPRLRVMNADGRPQSACQFLNQEKLRKNSERRAQNQTENAVFGLALPSRILFYLKIVKGERRTKRKTQFSGLALPSRILFYLKIVKGECRTKRKTQFSGLALPSRFLSYSKIAKRHRQGKRLSSFEKNTQSPVAQRMPARRNNLL